MDEKRIVQEFIAKRVALELNDGDVVNLGIGLPTLVANFVSEDKSIILQSENGYVGLGQKPEEGFEDPYITNAGGLPSSINKGGAFFDSSLSFGIIRGGHVAATVLGALQVDQEGNLANYMIPGKMIPGMGGAMDLVTGAKKVIVAMEHTAKGKAKILKKCSLPLTAAHQVNLIITEMAVFEVTPEGLVLKELNPKYTIEDLKDVTDAEFEVSENLIDLVV